MVAWLTGNYHPVVFLPDEYEVRDFTTGNYTPSECDFDIGRYDELRPACTQQSYSPMEDFYMWESILVLPLEHHVWHLMTVK